MSAVPPKADICPRDQDVCFGPMCGRLRVGKDFLHERDTDGKCATAETEAKDFRIRFVISAKKAIEVQDVAFEAPPKCDVLSLAFVKHQRLLGSN
jgi:hypothetical protein